MSQTTQIVPRGAYALRESLRFLCGFTPASGGARACGDALETAFLLDGTHEPAAVRVTQPSASAVVVETFGTRDHETATRQIARVLSLDGDGALLESVAARDPVIAQLLAARPGFRPVCFPSAYEAGIWGVLAQRIPMRVAAALKRMLAEQFGQRIETPSGTFHTLPHPERLLSLEAIPGVPDEKVRRLHGIAAAARDGRLAVDRLRAMPPAHALAELRQLHGVGPWTAEHILYRGAGAMDALASSEPRVLRAARLHYGVDGADFGDDDLARIAEAWRPVRMWVSILLVSSIAERPEWHGPEVRGAKPKRRRVSRGLFDQRA